MNVIDNYIIENELYFKKLEYNKSSKFVEIKVPNTELKFKFDENHIKKLENHELLAEIKTLKHYKHYGFSYKNYAEFFVVDKNVFNVIYGDESNLNIDLKFNIGKYIIEFNTVSSFCCLLIEPYYSLKSEAICDKGLTEYFDTIKILNAPMDKHEEILIQAIYYLNTHFYKSKDISFSVFNLNFDFESYEKKDFTTSGIIGQESKELSNFKHIEPLILYLEACKQEIDAFMGFYRIIEFFWNIVLERELKTIRYKTSITEKKIIKLLNNRREKDLLRLLLNRVLSNEIKEKIINYLKNNDIIKENTFDSFCVGLYKYRNSIVHSKENKKQSMKMSGVFGNIGKEYKAWLRITKYVAECCINQFNR